MKQNHRQRSRDSWVNEPPQEGEGKEGGREGHDNQFPPHKTNPRPSAEFSNHQENWPFWKMTRPSIQ